MRYIRLFEEKKYDYHEVRNIINHYINKYNSRSFMSGDYYKQNYNQDIQNFKKYMLAVNIDFDIYMKEYHTEIFNDDDYINCCGFMDALLYSYNNQHPLSGNLLIEREDESSECEHITKYYYGYQDYDLGLKYILQSYATLNDFYFACAEHFCKAVFTSESAYLTHCNIKEEDFKQFSKTVRFKNCSVCIIDLKILHEFVIDEYSTIYEKFIENFEMLVKPSIMEKDWCLEYFGADMKQIDIIKMIGDPRKYKEDIDFRFTANKYNL